MLYREKTYFVQRSIKVKQFHYRSRGFQVFKVPRFHDNGEPSALEGLVQSFITSPLSFLIRLSSVDWPSWRSERNGRNFCEVSSGEKTFVSLTLISTPVLIFSSWVQLSDSTSARGRSEELRFQLFVSR